MRSNLVGLLLAFILFLQPLGQVAADAIKLSPGDSPKLPITNYQLPITNYKLPITPSLPAICSSSLQLQNPTACPELGPGGYASQIVAAGLPYPFPSLPITPVRPFRG